MKIAIVGPLNRGYEEIRLIKEAQRRFSQVSYFPIPMIKIEFKGGEVSVKYKDKDLLDFDVILPRIPRSYKNFGFALLTVLKGEGKPLPIEPISVIWAHNKFATLERLDKEGILVPKTYMALSRKEIEKVLDRMKYPVVIKLVYGSKGQGVMFADSKQSAISVIDALERFDEPIFVEEYIENTGEDIRAYIVGDEVFASMKRIAKKGERRANIGMGGKGEAYVLTDNQRIIAEKVAKVLKMHICGVDLMESKYGTYVIEANVNAQFKGLETATGKNVAGRIVDYLAEGL